MFVNLLYGDSESHERFQPQGGRDVCACKQKGWRDHRAHREGSDRAHQILERRSGPGGTAAFDAGTSRCGRQAARLGELHGPADNCPQMKLPALLAFVFLLTGCGHKPVTVATPPTPSIQQKVPAGTPPAESDKKSSEIPLDSLEIPPDAKPVLVETGIASWYGAPYHNRRGSNGEIYDMHAMTAAHRTLPLGTIVRVTDVGSGNSAVVRITDRGPFIEGRIVDLSQAAAKTVGLVQKGTAKVRLEVLKTPSPIESGGRWAVQIGAFEREKAARDFAEHISRRYQTAKILTFNSPIGNWWVRVRVKGDLRARAEEVMHAAKTNEGAIFLVR